MKDKQENFLNQPTTKLLNVLLKMKSEESANRYQIKPIFAYAKHLRPGCIKLGYTTDNYSTDMPISFNSK